MKYRKGFVTNSSSSSYVCDICQHVEAGYDLCLSEAKMYECEEGHTFCKDHIEKYDLDFNVNTLKYILHKKTFKNDEQHLKIITILSNPKDENLQQMIDLIEEITQVDYNEEYDFPSELCPICNKTVIKKNEIIKYLANKFNFKIKDIEKEIRNNFYK